MLRIAFIKFERHYWTIAGLCSFCIVRVLLPLTAARAEIVLDEFLDPFQIILPAQNGQYQTQLNVGPLSARRSANCYAERATTGRIDANLTVPSALFSGIDRINIDPQIGNGTIGINVLYFFDTFDVTQGGTNDRIALDFAFLRSVIPLARVDVFMQDAVDNYVSQQFNIATRDERFTLEFPFSSFAPRGGGITRMDTQHVHIFSLTLGPAFFTTVDPINFSTALERIRITGAIPEPGAQSVLTIGLFIRVWWSARKRRRSYETTDDFRAVHRVGCLAGS